MGMAVPVDRGRYLALDPTYWWAGIIGVPQSRAHSFGKRPAGHFLDMVPSRAFWALRMALICVSMCWKAVFVYRRVMSYIRRSDLTE